MPLRSHYEQAMQNACLAGLPEVTEEMFNSALAKAMTHVMSSQERQAQLVSFVWGNALESDRGTRETVHLHLNLEPS